MELWKRLESVGDATDEADGNEDDEERGETAEDDARRISVLAPLAENHCVWGFIKVIGCEDQLSWERTNVLVTKWVWTKAMQLFFSGLQQISLKKTETFLST